MPKPKPPPKVLVAPKTLTSYQTEVVTSPWFEKLEGGRERADEWVRLPVGRDLDAVPADLGPRGPAWPRPRGFRQQLGTQADAEDRDPPPNQLADQPLLVA